MLLPAGVEEVAELVGADAATRVEAYDREVSGEAERERLASEKKREEERLAGERAEAERLAKERAAREKEETERLAAERQARPRAGVEAPGPCLTLSPCALTCCAGPRSLQTSGWNGA